MQTNFCKPIIYYREENNEKEAFKQFTIMMLLFVFSINLFAIPANKKPVTVKQPNGKSLTLTIKGDERVHWATTIDQYTIIGNEEGTFVYGQLSEDGDLIPSNFIASNSNERSLEERLFLSTLPYDIRYSNRQIKEKVSLISRDNNGRKVVTTGSVNGLVILVAFSDKAFTYTQSNFDNLCNQVGYSVNGATGSVKDYYYDNSNGVMTLNISVVGPFTLPNTSAYYAASGGMSYFVSSALALADPTVDFSQYRNGNSNVSNIHFVFAGQAQSSTGNTSEIWPHESRVSSNIIKDGVSFTTYSCSAEKSSTTTMDGIGTMCHEMGHSLGLMDLYDTDYASSGGTAVTPGSWDLMDQGSYNNNGNTPPYLNGYERQVLNWDAPILLTTNSIGVLPCLADSLVSYKIYLNGNEYFLCEHRKQKGWDAYIPGNGMVIFHADQSRIDQTFYYNTINAVPTNRGFFIETSTGVSTDNGTAYAPFAGASGQNYFTSESTPQSKYKNGTLTNKPITHIQYINDSTITFNFLSNLPQVKTQAVTISTIRGTSATVNGSIVYMGNGSITEKGMYWHTNLDSLNTTSGHKVVSTTTDTLIATNLTNLPSSSTIYFFAFATNSEGTAIANEKLYFNTTDGLGTVLTSNPTNIVNNGATLNGSLISIGDAPMIEKGFVYSTNSATSPTIYDNKLTLIDTTSGAYSIILTGLSEQTTYYYRAYVTTSVGTKYGAKKNFTTTFPAIIDNTISDNQSFCVQGTPQQLVGLNPTGGYGNFAYKWEQKTRNGSWIDASQINNQLNYQPEQLTDSTFYRRIVTSNLIKDTSNIILISIKNSWGGVLSSTNDTINSGSTTGTIMLTNKIGSILNWERKKNNEDWTTLSQTTTSYSEILTDTGNYIYRVLVQLDNCPSAYSTEREIYVLGNNSLTDVDLNLDMKLYPNPSNGNITITSSFTQPVQLRVVNSLGQSIKSETSYISNKTLDLSNVENGIYLITISANGKQTTKTLIINK
ncbi:MAG: M6 family metalloprotease domain-containing protein [Bacteroidales bacterium]